MTEFEKLLKQQSRLTRRRDIFCDYLTYLHSSVQELHSHSIMPQYIIKYLFLLLIIISNIVINKAF